MGPSPGRACGEPARPAGASGGSIWARRRGSSRRPHGLETAMPGASPRAPRARRGRVRAADAALPAEGVIAAPRRRRRSRPAGRGRGSGGRRGGRRGAARSATGARPVRVDRMDAGERLAARTGAPRSTSGSRRPVVLGEGEAVAGRHVEPARRRGLGRRPRGCRRGRGGCAPRAWRSPTVSARAVPPPPSSVVTKVLPMRLGGGVEHADGVDLEHLHREGRGEGLDGGDARGPPGPCRAGGGRRRRAGSRGCGRPSGSRGRCRRAAARCARDVVGDLLR